MVISLVFWILAACLNAVMDTLADPPHFNASVFRKLNPDFWLKTDSWDNKYNDIDGDGEGDPEGGLRFHGLLAWMNNLTDGWHITQSLMIIALASSVITFRMTHVHCAIALAIYGISWVIPFNIMYNHVLKTNHHER